MVFQVTGKVLKLSMKSFYDANGFWSTMKRTLRVSIMYSLHCFHMRIADTYGCMKGIDYWNANMSSFEHCSYHDILCFLKLYFFIYRLFCTSIDISYICLYINIMHINMRNVYLYLPRIGFLMPPQPSLSQPRFRILLGLAIFSLATAILPEPPDFPGRGSQTTGSRTFQALPHGQTSICLGHNNYI